MQVEDRKLAWSGVFVLAVIAVELAWFLFVGPPPHSSANAATNQEVHYWEWVWSAAFWTAAFTGVLTVSTVFLWIATRDAAGTAERALIEHERPWIFRDLVTVTWRHTPGVQVNDWMVSIRWKNVGKAPALLTDFVFWMQDIQTLPSKPNYDGLNVLGVPDALPAKDDAEYNTQPAGPANGLRQDGSPIEYVVWGRLRYKEMNGTPHESGFAILLGPHFPVAASHNSDAYNYYT